MTTDFSTPAPTNSRFSKWLSTVGDVLTLKTQVFIRFRDNANGMRDAIALFLLAALIGTAATFMIQAVRNPIAEIASVNETFDQVFQQINLAGGDVPPEVIAAIKDQFAASLGIAENIMSLPTALPRPVGQMFTALGQWISNPFMRLGAFFSYALWVLLFARVFLGGKGSLRAFFATTPLYGVPQMFTILSPIPCVGGLIGLIAMIWGWIIYVKATAVSQGWVHQQLSADGTVVSENTQWGRAIFAAILPALLLFFVIAIVGTLFLLTIIAAANGQS